jgi:hypothetical protein
MLALPSVQVQWVGSGLLGALMAPIFPTLYALAASFMLVSGSAANLFVIGASAGVSPPSSHSCAIANLCLFEPLLFYGGHALQLTAPGGGGEGGRGLKVSDSARGGGGGSFVPMEEVREGSG